MRLRANYAPPKPENLRYAHRQVPSVGCRTQAEKKVTQHDSWHMFAKHDSPPRYCKKPAKKAALEAELFALSFFTEGCLQSHKAPPSQGFESALPA